MNINALRQEKGGKVILVPIAFALPTPLHRSLFGSQPARGNQASLAKPSQQGRTHLKLAGVSVPLLDGAGLMGAGRGLLSLAPSSKAT